LSEGDGTVELPLAAAWSRALSDVVAGRGSAEALSRLSTAPGAEELVEETLTQALQRQDWDVVEALLPVCRSAPHQRYVAPLSAILDRECLEISNGLLVEVLGSIGTPEVVPALRRALVRTSVPQADWAPDAQGGKQADELRSRCAAVLAAIESRAAGAEHEPVSQAISTEGKS
jgi:hypothetical protein